MIVPVTEVIASRDHQELFRKALPPGEYVMGRDADCDIPIDFPRVSRRHARLELRYSDWLIEDLDSANGTWVGEQRIAEPTLLFPRQDLRLGNVQVRLRRVASFSGPDESMAPQATTVLRFLPVELRDDRRYRVRRLLAMGGMGAVLEVEDTSLRRKVAMKVLLDGDSPEGIARFVEEAQVTAQLAHPNIVPVYDLNVNERDNPFFTMKLLDGETLRRVLIELRNDHAETAARYGLEELVRILSKACDGLAFAHAKGVIHRDLKPDNIMLGEFGEVVVMDWGLAKPLDCDGAVAEGAERRSQISSVRQEAGAEFATQERVVIGTPHFMAPEQAAGELNTVDVRTDVYALGAMLYEMLTLRFPVEGRDTDEILQNVCAGRIRHPREAVVTPPGHWFDGLCPEALAAVAAQALAREKEQRHQSVREFQRALRQAFLTDRQAAPSQTTTLLRR